MFEETSGLCQVLECVLFRYDLKRYLAYNLNIQYNKMLTLRSSFPSPAYRRTVVCSANNGFEAHNMAVKKLAKHLTAQKEEYERRKKDHMRAIYSTVHTIVLDDIEYLKSFTITKKGDEVVEDEQVPSDENKDQTDSA